MIDVDGLMSASEIAAISFDFYDIKIMPPEVSVSSRIEAKMKFRMKDWITMEVVEVMCAPADIIEHSG